jgi:hypothetical protein
VYMQTKEREHQQKGRMACVYIYKPKKGETSKNVEWHACIYTHQRKGHQQKVEWASQAAWLWFAALPPCTPSAPINLLVAGLGAVVLVVMLVEVGFLPVVVACRGRRKKLLGSDLV